MKKYIYQKFLLQCDYENTRIEEIPSYTGNLDEIPELGTEYCLLDIGKPITRKVSIRKLDTTIDTIDDWKRFEKNLQGIESLIILNEREESGNPLIDSYRNNTIKAYLYRILYGSKEIKIFFNPTITKRMN